MAKKKKKAVKKRKSIPLTPSRKARLIVRKILEYAEVGGMPPKECGVIYDAIDNCLIAVGDDPEVALSGLVDQIRTIASVPDANL
jgi:hypothetical protein